MGYQPHARAEGRAARGPSTRPSLSRSKLRQCPRLQRQESESLMRVTKTRILVADPSRKDRNPPPCIVDRSVKVTPLSGTRTHRRPARLNRAPTLYGACSVAVAGHALRWAAQRSCQNRASSAAVGFAAGAACQLRLLCGLASAGFAVYAFLSSQAAAHNTKPGSPRRAAFGLQGWPSRRVASRASATLSGSAASARPTLSPAAEPAWRAAHGRARRGGLHGRPGHVPSSGPRSRDPVLLSRARSPDSGPALGGSGARSRHYRRAPTPPSRGLRSGQHFGQVGRPGKTARRTPKWPTRWSAAGVPRRGGDMGTAVPSTRRSHRRPARDPVRANPRRRLRLALGRRAGGRALHSRATRSAGWPALHSRSVTLAG